MPLDSSPPSQYPLLAPQKVSVSRRPSQPSSSRGERRGGDTRSPLRTCEICLRPIKGAHVVAMGASHHPDCLCCADCKIPLKGDFYRFPYADTVYTLCEEHFMRREGNVCNTCQGPLKKNEQAILAANGKKYHLDHYRCKVCSQKIPTTYAFALHNGEPYCHFHAATKFSARCSGCDEAIMGVSMEDPLDTNQKLHENCFQIRTNYDISLLSYMPDRKGLKQDEAAYLQHEKIVNKMARRIVKHAYGFEKSAIACFSSVSRYSYRFDWGQALTSANKLRQHLDLLRDYPKSLPKGCAFPRQTDLQHSETCRKAEKLLDTHVFKHLLSGQQAESPAAKTEASEKLFALEYDVKVVVKELIRATLDGVLALSLGRGLVEVTDKLFAQLKAFPRELPRTFSTSSRSRSRSSERSPRLLALPSSSPSSPRGSILSELSDSPVDHFYDYSGERNRESSSSLSLDKLLEEIGENSASDARTIPNIIWRKEGGILHHEFLLVQICTPGRKDVWLRLERAAKRNFAALRKLNPTSVSSRFGPDDTAKIANSQDYLLIETSTIFSSVTFAKRRPTLVDLYNVLSCLVEKSTSYTLYKENCWFFCSVIVDLLANKFSGKFEDGYALEHAKSAAKEREAIRKKWLAMTDNNA